MINCTPKRNTYVALGSVLAVLITGLLLILNHFAKQRTMPLWVYLGATVLLTLVILMLLIKMMAGYKFISAGKETITTRHPLRGKTNSYSLDQVLVWEEETILANKREFKQLTLVFDDKTSFSISNHEHLHYTELFKYLQKKIPQKKSSQLSARKKK